MTLELAELMGAILGDGSSGVKSRENAVTVVVDHREDNYILRVASLMQSVFGVVPLFEGKGTVMGVTICSKMVVNYLEAAGIPAGCTYENKRVPSSIWASSQEYRAAFIRGLFDTDGCASGSLTFSAYNRDFAADVQLLLAEMGIRSDINTRDNNGDQITTLRVEGRESLFKFRDRIGFSIIRKAVELANLTDTASCVSGGPPVWFIQNMIMELGKGITTYSDPSIGRSLKAMERNPLMGFNALYGFILRALSAGYEQFAPVYKFVSMPLMEVEKAEYGEVEETIDIALWHDDHDFVANGIISHNTNPCYIYCLDSNTLVDNVTVVAHALGHNDFFKNNIYFAPTSQNMMNQLANNGTRIRRYMRRWGKERVTKFIDQVLQIETLIDPAKAWEKKVVKEIVIGDRREYVQPERLHVTEGHEYMEDYINTPEWKARQHDVINRKEAAKEIGLFKDPTKDILGYIRDHAPLKPWQADIVAMIHEESMYFAPQRCTHMMNEGWASFIDHNIMCKKGLCGLGQATEDCGIVDYAIHKAGVLGGKYSLNPYKLGFCLFQDIEERWDKGRFGTEWEECEDVVERQKWDKKLGLGHDKVFEVRKYYNDVTALLEFFTEDFCNKYEFFEWKHYPNGEYRIENRDYKSIKKKLLQRYVNGSLPTLRLTDSNFRGDGAMMIQHEWEGRVLYDPYVQAVLQSMCALWGEEVYIASRNSDGEEIVYCGYGEDDDLVEVVTREEFEKMDE
jgi:stage V sporulation protein R